MTDENVFSTKIVHIKKFDTKISQNYGMHAMKFNESETLCVNIYYSHFGVQTTVYVQIFAAHNFRGFRGF